MKKIRIKSAIPIYLAAAVWVLAGLIFPGFLMKLGGLAVTALVSCGVGWMGGRVFPGKVMEVREAVDTGDAQANRVIEEARAQLDKLRASNDVLPDPEISAKLDRMTRSGEAILAEMEKDPKRLSEVRRFMNYFLPTAQKLVANYVTLSQTPAKGENITSAMTKVEDSLDMIAAAFEKQLDSLYRNQSFDIEADVSVLETLLKSEGLVNHQDFKAPGREDAPKAQTRA